MIYVHVHPLTIATSQVRANNSHSHHDINLFPLQNKSEVVKRALSAPKRLHLQIPQLLLPNLQQRFDEVRLPERDVQENPVGLEDAVHLSVASTKE